MSYLRISAVEQLRRDMSLLSSITNYHEMEQLIWRGRRVGLAPFIYEEHGTTETPKWFILDVIFIGATPSYWLVSLEGKDGREQIFSFTSVATSNDSFPKCFKVRFEPLPSIDRVAHPDDIRARLRSLDDLNYHSVNKKYKSSKRWTSISKQSAPEVYAKLPLGKLYRAIDVGSLVPVFRTNDKIIGLVIK